MSIKVEKGYVDKSSKGYLVEGDFWGTVHSWDITEAEFYPESSKIAGVKVIRITTTYDEHAPLELRSGFNGQNTGKVQYVCMSKVS